MSEKEHTKTPVKQDAAVKAAGLEKAIDEIVNKKQPLQLPADVRAWLANNVWWLALIGGILSLWGAWGFWQAGHLVDGFSRLANEYARAAGITTYATELGPMWYLALAGMVIEGVLLLLAVPKLKDHKKSGWNLLFYVSLVSIVVGVVYLLVPSYGFGSLLGTLIGTAISWFFLFQIRSHFTK